MLAGDIQPLFHLENFGDLIPAISAIMNNIERRLMHYTMAMGTIVQEYGNVNAGNNTYLQEIREITGKFAFDDEKHYRSTSIQGAFSKDLDHNTYFNPMTL